MQVLWLQVLFCLWMTLKKNISVKTNASCSQNSLQVCLFVCFPLKSFLEKYFKPKKCQSQPAGRRATLPVSVPGIKDTQTPNAHTCCRKPFAGETTPFPASIQLSKQSQEPINLLHELWFPAAPFVHCQGSATMTNAATLSPKLQDLIY